MKSRAKVCCAIAVSLLAAIAAACGPAESGPLEIATTASAQVMGPEGESLGTVTFTQAERGVLVQADLSGLTPGAHGFHIHETGSCAPDFSAAGDHFAPSGIEHGYFNPEGHHAGDLPNIYAGADGITRADFFSGAISLADGEPNSLFDEDGSAIIVHEKGDTYGADAGAGGRVGCGVVARN
ncbi:MAG: superoxide dismutase family protein [Chloroflexi bacterium]|nr:superoxide dismutase family protein [Chloroflexota bacterium]